jgi:integrase/recombinase XerD
MTSQTLLPAMLRGFFEDYLAAQRDVSPNTILAYRDAIKLLPGSAARRSGRQVIRLQLADLGPVTVLAFLDYPETERHNCAATRNRRLIAIHRFFAYAADQDPRHADLRRRVPGTPVKKTSSSSLTYLGRDEVNALLAAPSPADRPGLRDRALLTLPYNTGARASEAAGLDIHDVRLQTPSQVRIFGKGRKERVCPLWQETAGAVRAYPGQRDDSDQPGAPLFLNAHGKRITRFGLATILQRHVAVAASRQASLASKLVSPHTIRHTTAPHLLQAGVELNVIKSRPGHVSTTTTSQYVEIDMAMKRTAIERCQPPVPAPEGESRWHARQDIIQWLKDPSAPESYVKQNPRRPTPSNQTATAALPSST